MTLFCKNHPKEAAHWQCNKCGSLFCKACIDQRMGGYMGNDPSYFCPVCNVKAEWIAPSNIIRPFWEVLHTFFTYPLRNVFTIGFILAIAVVGSIFTKPGLITLLVGLLVFILLMRYSLTAMASTANGSLIPPPVNLNTLTTHVMQAFAPALLTIVMFAGGVFVMMKINMVLGIVCIVFGYFSLPAMIMAYMAKGFFHAINPVLFITIMFRIGWAYFLMIFFLFLLMLAPNALIYFVMDMLPEEGLNFVVSMANIYYTIIFYHFIGYVLLQYHKEIGYSLNPEDFIGSSKTTSGSVVLDETTKLRSKIEYLAKEGKYDEALREIKVETKGNISEPDISKLYFKLLTLKNDPGLTDHLGPHITMMITDNDKPEACEVFRKSLETKTPVSLSDPDYLKLAGWLNEGGFHKESVAAYNRIISNPAAGHLQPMAYFKAACILYEKLNNKAKANKVFVMLKKKYPMDDIIPHVDNYLRRLEAGE